MMGGKNSHCSNGMAPAFPANSKIEHSTAGCPGNSKMASALPTIKPSPHTEQPPLFVGTIAATVGKGEVGAGIGAGVGAGTGAGVGEGVVTTVSTGAEVAGVTGAEETGDGEKIEPLKGAGVGSGTGAGMGADVGCGNGGYVGCGTGASVVGASTIGAAEDGEDALLLSCSAKQVHKFKCTGKHFSPGIVQSDSDVHGVPQNPRDAISSKPQRRSVFSAS